MDEDEFEIECMALEAIFSESFSREGRKLWIKIEPVDPNGDTLEEWVFTLIMDIPDKYPEERPVFQIMSLENTVYSDAAKTELLRRLEDEAEAMKGEQMIYNLVEWLREHLIEYVEISKQSTRQTEGPSERPGPTEASAKAEKPKEKMTKAQKRRFYSRLTQVYLLDDGRAFLRFGAVEEKPRGWNWVDIVAHLSSRPQSQNT